MPLDRWQIHFEVQVFEAERWMIDYVTRDRDEALAVAEELLRRPEIWGVRVVKEVHNSESNVTAARIVHEAMRERPRAAPGRAAPHGAPVRSPTAGAPRGADPRRLGGDPAVRRRGATAPGLAALASLAAAASGTAVLLWFAFLA